MYVGLVTRDQSADRLLRASARLSRWATRHASIDIPYAQARLLALMDDLGPMRITALAEHDNTSQPTMTTQVQRLVHQWWARRQPDPVDARATLASLTPTGQRELDRLRAAREATLAPVLARLHPTQRAAVPAAVAVLEALLAAAADESTATRQEA